MSNVKLMKSVFLENLRYFFARVDGTYAFPKSADGDLLKQAKKEIEGLREMLLMQQPELAPAPAVTDADCLDAIATGCCVVQNFVVNDGSQVEVWAAIDGVKQYHGNSIRDVLTQAVIARRRG